MATPPLIPNWITITVNGTCDIQKVANVYSFITNTNISTGAQAVAMATAFWNWVSATLKGTASALVNFDSVVCTTHYPGVPEISGTYTIPQPQPGLITGDLLDNAISEVISWKTAFTGRKYRGRTFLFPVGETSVGGDRFSSSYLTSAAAAASQIASFGGIVTNAVVLAIASRKGLFINYVASWGVDLFLEVLKLRLPNHRKHKKPRVIP
jgi:hypothetical protein